VGIEIFKLFTPGVDMQKQERSQLLPHWLKKMHQNLKEDINANIDVHFERLFNIDFKD
jgi:hypothetical protein